MAACTPIPRGLRGQNPEGEAGEERVGETRVVERAAARGDGESPKLGPAGAWEYERGVQDLGSRGSKLRLKKGLGVGDHCGWGLRGTGARGSRRMGAREGSWRWRESSFEISYQGDWELGE